MHFKVIKILFLTSVFFFKQNYLDSIWNDFGWIIWFYIKLVFESVSVGFERILKYFHYNIDVCAMLLLKITVSFKYKNWMVLAASLQILFNISIKAYKVCQHHFLLEPYYGRKPREILQEISAIVSESFEKGLFVCLLFCIIWGGSAWSWHVSKGLFAVELFYFFVELRMLVKLSGKAVECSFFV